MLDRYRHFTEEKRALETGLPWKLLFIATRGERQLTAETWNNYSFTGPLMGRS